MTMDNSFWSVFMVNAIELPLMNGSFLADFVDNPTI